MERPPDHPYDSSGDVFHYVDPDALERKIRCHQAAFAEHFITASQCYIDGLNNDGIELRPHQPGVLEEMSAFFKDTAQDVGRSILVPLPPNSGKSTMTALLCSMVGVGKQTTTEFAAPRALTIVPRTIAQQQIHKTYQTFVPDLRVKAFERNYKIDRQESFLANFEDVDVLTLSYKACLTMLESEWRYIGEWTDVLILDEVHRALGLNIAAQIRKLMKEYRPTTIAMSATPNFSKEHSVVNKLGIERSVTPITPREAIELNISNGVRLFALFSGEEVHFGSKRGSLTDADVKPLMYSKKRNDLILKIMEDEAAVGRQGVVQCLSGNNSEHAIMIAAAACERRIFDPKTGKRRNLRVSDVGVHRKDTLEVIEQFKRGEYDALTFTKSLIEAFDHPIRYLIPSLTTSEVDMNQIVGRGGRLSEDTRPTDIFYILDRYTSITTKKLQSPFSVFGEKLITQGVVINRRNHQPESDAQGGTTLRSRGQSGIGRPAEGPRQSLDTPEFSASVKEALASIPDGTLLEELLIVCTEYQDVPPGYIPLNDLPAVQDGIITPEGARYALLSQADDHGRPLFVSVRAGKIKQHVLPKEAQKFLLDRCAKGDYAIERLQIDAFLKSHGWPRLSFDAFLRLCDQGRIEYVNKKGTIRMRPTEARRLFDSITSHPFIDPETQIAVSELSRILGEKGSSEMHNFLKKQGSVYTDHIDTVRKGTLTHPYRVTAVLPKSVAAQLLELYVQTSEKKARMLGSRSIAAVVDEAAQAAKQAFWVRKMQRTIAKTAIDDFLGLGPKVPKPTKAAPPPAPMPEGLDGSYGLSVFNKNWRTHASCKDIDAEAFCPPFNRRTLALAKAICNDCKVKGDCLLFALENTSEAVMGGMTEAERRKLDRRASVEWLRSTRPSAQ